MKVYRFKILLLVVMVILLTLGVVAGASAWSEGDPPGGFGTHDWIIGTANALAGADHGWLDLNVAYLWSDYPDTVLQDNINHIYYPGLSTAAPGFVQAHYDEAVRALQSGDRVTASKEAALMAHYYDDLWNPWHADYSNLLAQALYHSRYEEDVLGHEPADATLDQLHPRFERERLRHCRRDHLAGRLPHAGESLQLVPGLCDRGCRWHDQGAAEASGQRTRRPDLQYPSRRDCAKCAPGRGGHRNADQWDSAPHRDL